MENQEENEGGNETVEQKLRKLDNAQLQQVAVEWKRIYESDKSADNQRNWILCKRECARRGLQL